MVATALLLGFLITATVTDIRWRRIFNWTTYPGMILALAASALATATGMDVIQGDTADRSLWGIVPFSDAAAGWFCCGAAMLVCYVFFPGGIGGGDVKLIAMIGAFLGLYSGLEAMLWTFVLGACQALITLTWRWGALTLLRRAAAHVANFVRLRGHVSPQPTEERSAAVSLFLSPSALAAVLLVRWNEMVSAGY
jgi:prepilin peptidase CpaA